MRRFVGVRKTSPPAHVIDNNNTEIRHSRLDYIEQVLEPSSTLDGCPGLSSIDEGADDTEIVSRRVERNCSILIRYRVLLMFGAHSHVFRRTKPHRQICIFFFGRG